MCLSRLGGYKQFTNCKSLGEPVREVREPSKGFELKHSFYMQETEALSLLFSRECQKSGKHTTIKSGRLWFWGVDIQENPGGTPEARSCLCILSGFLPHDLCHGQDSSRCLPATLCSPLSVSTTIFDIPPCHFPGENFKFLAEGWGNISEHK